MQERRAIYWLSVGPSRNDAYIPAEISICRNKHMLQHGSDKIDAALTDNNCSRMLASKHVSAALLRGVKQQRHQKHQQHLSTTICEVKIAPHSA